MRKQWWDGLGLQPATAALVAARGVETPGELACLARAVPADFRRVFGGPARADLCRALAAHLDAAAIDEGGYGVLLVALEELGGERPPAASAGPHLSYGVLPTDTTPPTRPLPPLPPLGPRGAPLPPPRRPPLKGG